MGVFLYLKSKYLISQKLQVMYTWSQCGEARIAGLHTADRIRGIHFALKVTFGIAISNAILISIPVGFMQNSV
jgi:hypothetical protein